MIWKSCAVIYNVLALERPCAFLDVWVPSVGKITHDHTYVKLSSNEMPDMTTELADVRVEPAEVMNVTGEPDAIVDAMDSCHCTGQQQEADMKSSLVVSLEERARIERKTRNQSSQQE